MLTFSRAPQNVGEDEMAILDALVPGRAKANTRQAIAELNDLARKEAERQSLSPATAMLWNFICDGASDLMLQLFVANEDKTVDWKLKGRNGRLKPPRLVAIFWWMVLFQLVLFKKRGAEGYEVEDEFSALHSTAQRFLKSISSVDGYGEADPGHWDAGWASQVPLEAALGLYNHIMQILGLRIDLQQRINRVSLFTSASERAYDSNIKMKVSRRNGTKPDEEL